MLRAGIVGLPNVGKSTLFNAVTQTRKALAANYRFCTIEPNTGIVTVPDDRLAVLAKMSASAKIIPAVFEFVDIAGLVKGASKGEGLGNQFLGHIREVDAIVQVVRCFEDPNIEHVMDTIDPVRDIEIINTELVLADLESVEKRKIKQQKAAKSGDKKAIAELELLDRLGEHLDKGKTVVTADLSPDDKTAVKGFFLLTSKPTLFGCNVAEGDLATADENKYVAQVRSYVGEHHDTGAVVVSAEIESELVTLTEEERAEYLAGLGVSDTGASNLIREAYTLLGLRTYLTTGEKETRAWTIHAGEKAPQAAGVIHSDFEKAFISAECVSYDDLVTAGSFARARELGKLRTEGKEYVVQDGDVIEFKTYV
ncbi:MAG: redox-regulated ATPase YchF [Acidobacteriaceae bacterium]|nr:redox-regulated ATPase YchF [Acidobacteriaceae bacterium]MBV9501683.1 redox-regulated ATPase YchF [Acidobacteriaceae bacterium]